MASHLQVHSSLRWLSGLSSSCSCLSKSINKPSYVLLRTQCKLISLSIYCRPSSFQADNDSLAISRRLRTTQMATTTLLHKILQVITATLSTTVMTIPPITTTTRSHHIPAPAISHPTPALATARLTQGTTLQPQQPPPQPEPLLPTTQPTTTEQRKPRSTPRTRPSPTTPELLFRHSSRHTSPLLVSNSGAKSWTEVGH